MSEYSIATANKLAVDSIVKQSIYSDTNYCELRNPHDQIDWSGTAEINHKIYKASRIREDEDISK